MRALVQVLRQELAAVRDAGVTVAQFDDPHLCSLVDTRVRAQFADADGEALPERGDDRVSQYVLEFTIPVAGDVAVLRQLPDDRLIGLGCVDCRGAIVESPELIAERVRQALRHVDCERVWLNPDCGFAPGSAADIPIDEAYARLVNEARAARLLRYTSAR
jgi:5-methyltetrahydropteroyltriglutamate--homocysteine methyltransferase